MPIFAALKPLQPFLWLEDLPFPVNGGPGNYTELCLTVGWEDHGVHGGCLLTTWDGFCFQNVLDSTCGDIVKTILWIFVDHTQS